MKTYEEMAQSALTRGKAIRKQRRNFIWGHVGILSALVACCLVLILTLGNRGVVPNLNPAENMYNPIENTHAPVEDVQDPTENVQTPAEDVPTPTENVPTPTENTHTPTEDMHTGNTVANSSGLEVDRPVTSIDSAEEYKNFLDKNPSDQKFISYSKLREIGEFNRVTFLSNTKADDYSHYMYELCDASGYTLYLYVKAGQSEDSVEMVSEENVNPHDLRKLNDKSSGAYFCEGYEYRYVNGELLSIRWENEAYSFVLSGESVLSNYPETSNTILGYLLTVDTISVATIDLQKIMLE